MRRPSQPALTDAATGRVSMPFLPTLAVVALLGAASLYCPSSAPPVARSDVARVEALASDPLTTQSLAPVAAAPSPMDFAGAAASAPAADRLPASLAFAEAFPLNGAVPRAAPVHAGAPARPAARFAAANRRPCPGRRCPEAPQRGSDPFAAAHAEAEVSAGSDPVPRPALPFTEAMADTVARTLAPAARVVGDAADLMRGGAAAVQGSVSVAVAECLR